MSKFNICNKVYQRDIDSRIKILPLVDKMKLDTDTHGSYKLHSVIGLGNSKCR